MRGYSFLLISRALLLSTGLATAVGCARGPVGFWSRNRFDRSGDHRHGPWRGYLDARQKQQLLSKGRFRHGRAVGRWQYFSPTGERERTEQFHRHPAGLITLTIYHSNGRVARRGQARYESDAATDRFFWFGEWRCYNAAGRPLPPEHYVNGVRTDTQLVAPTQLKSKDKPR
ncbi:hypothetical protein CDA63_08875 [Hymenobacter amundsenii]|uniref:Toxin-antitoxin system YwqK family antitoxin n=1 Tax=Hymenobacter amundsenii TaxID=2006685 RepID=A0A246FL88_9BACT|nr:hypothetical protein [Hymenobacter amundsenii]OWP63480.1 hypothetical protein CDA63_08875 [Hymenobacter amundsenii]